MIIMADKLKGQIKVIMEFFGKGESLSVFRKELADLSDADKLELAQGSAKALGYTQDQVSFKLT